MSTKAEIIVFHMWPLHKFHSLFGVLFKQSRPTVSYRGLFFCYRPWSPIYLDAKYIGLPASIGPLAITIGLNISKLMAVDFSSDSRELHGRSVKTVNYSALSSIDVTRM